MPITSPSGSGHPLSKLKERKRDKRDGKRMRRRSTTRGDRAMRRRRLRAMVGVIRVDLEWRCSVINRVDVTKREGKHNQDEDEKVWELATKWVL
ncbi:hypothetical protein QYF36_017748 [Acer negundo]|nr:hypothetical protein QYF36_017748 [Acer negundo]